MSVLASVLGELAAQQPPPPASDKLTAPPVDYPAIMPVLIILTAACVGVLFEAFLPKHQRWAAQVALSFLTVVAVPRRGWRTIIADASGARAC